MNKSYWFTKNHNLTPNIGKQANSRRIVKSLSVAAAANSRIFLQGVFQNIAICLYYMVSKYHLLPLNLRT